MLRKTMIALFAAASVGMFAPSVASARGGFGGGGGGGGGFHGGGGGGFHGGGGGGGFHGGGVGGGGLRGGRFWGGGVPFSAPRGGGVCSPAAIGAEVSAQPLLRAVDFAVEPSQPMVSAAAVSTMGSTTGADLRSVHLQSD